MAGTINLPMTDSEGVTSFEIYGNPTPEAQRPTAAPSTISTQYFKTMEVPIIKGRDFTEDDNVATNPVIIISQSLAKKYFPGVDPIGKKLRPAGMPSEPVWMEIVGVVGDVRLGATQRDIESAMYFPAAQSLHSCCLYTVVRTRLDPLAVEHSIENVVAAMDKDLPITQVSTMDQLIAKQLSQARLGMILLGSFAILALLLTIVGIYGVIAYSVSRQTRDIGVRMALGARRLAVLGSVLKEAAALLGAGVVIGLVATIASDSLLRNMVYGVSQSDARIFAFSVALVVTSGLIAAIVPAFRAATINPVQALRNE